MAVLNERERLHSFINGEVPPPVYVKLSLECTDAATCMLNVKSVLDVVIKQDDNHWPNDRYWQDNLPGWLMSTFKKYTLAELKAVRANRALWNSLPWSFGSWLDRMKERDWKWWSSQVNSESNLVVVYLIVSGVPTSTKALEHLFVAAGARIISENR